METRYIFETKEKKVDPKDKAAKVAKEKNAPQQKVIAHLQVLIYLKPLIS